MATLLTSLVAAGTNYVQQQIDRTSTLRTSVPTSGGALGNALALISTSKTDKVGTLQYAHRDRLFADNVFILPSDSVQDLGQVSSQVDIPVIIWNSSRHAAKLSAVTITGPDGITTDFTPPDHLVSNATATGHVYVSADSPEPFIDNTVSFEFGALGSFSYKITGTRIALFAFEPDAINASYVRLNFATNILVTQSNREQRIATRMAPALSYGYTFTTRSRKQSARLGAFLLSNAGRKFGLPVWFDAQRHGPVNAGVSTFSIVEDFANWDGVSLVALIDDDGAGFELLTISSTTSDTLTTTKPTSREHGSTFTLVPVRLVRFNGDSTEFSELTSANLRTTLEFDEDVG